MSLSEQIHNEIVALRKTDGLIHAEDVVAWAKNNPESALHKQFEWDDSEAAKEYRLWQARRVIAVHVVNSDDDRHRRLISLTIDRPKGGGYRFVEDVQRSKELLAVALDDALGELRRTRTKYQHLKELADVWQAIDKHAKEERVAA